MKISIIVPMYNERAVIGECLVSLFKQDYGDFEVIVVDDGSSDDSVAVVEAMLVEYHNLKLLKQDHLGPGQARNLGAKRSSGEILVFVDADMEFESDFLTKLTEPIVDGTSIGTFSKEEYLLNKDNDWARFWNINLGRSAERMHPDSYPDVQPVFRAILKSNFDQVGGFETKVGYTDDWTVSRKLGVMASAAPGAKYYHRNPASLKEVWTQARWFGKNEFLTKNFGRLVFNLVRYSLVVSLIKGLIGSVKVGSSKYLVFKIVYDGAVWTSLWRSFLGEQKNK